MTAFLFAKQHVGLDRATILALKEALAQGSISMPALTRALDPLVIPSKKFKTDLDITRAAYQYAKCFVAPTRTILHPSSATSAEYKEVREIRDALRSNNQLYDALKAMQLANAPELFAVQGDRGFGIKILPRPVVDPPIGFLDYLLATHEIIPTEIVQVLRKGDEE